MSVYHAAQGYNARCWIPRARPGELRGWPGGAERVDALAEGITLVILAGPRPPCETALSPVHVHVFGFPNRRIGTPCRFRTQVAVARCCQTSPRCCPVPVPVPVDRLHSLHFGAATSGLADLSRPPLACPGLRT